MLADESEREVDMARTPDEINAELDTLPENPRTPAERQRSDRLHDELRAAKSTTVAKSDLVRTADGREFPTYQGEFLSWDIGSSFTPRDQSEGYPRTRAIIRAFAKHRPDVLDRERSSLINSSFDWMFGATKLLSLIDEERQKGDTPASRTRSLSERGPRAVGVGKARCSVCGKVGSKANLAKHEAGCRESRSLAALQSAAEKASAKAEESERRQDHRDALTAHLLAARAAEAAGEEDVRWHHEQRAKQHREIVG